MTKEQSHKETGTSRRDGCLDDKLELIRQKCYKVKSGKESDESTYFVDIPIRVADILLAIKTRYMAGTLQKEGEFKNGSEWFGEIAWEWDLRADDLTEQSEETITFLYDLLQ